MLIIAAIAGTALVCAVQQMDSDKTAVVDCTCTGVLKQFNDQKSLDALLRHLSASAKWRVAPCRARLKRHNTACETLLVRSYPTVRRWKFRGTKLSP